jgi:hypothetical protein
MTDKKQQLDLSQMMGALTGALDPSKTKEFAWYRSFSYPDVPDFQLDHVMSFAAASLFSHALNSDNIVYHNTAFVRVEDDSNFDGSYSDLSFSEFRKVIQTSNFMFYTSTNSAVGVHSNTTNSINNNFVCSVISLDKSIVDKVLSEFKDFYEQMEA